MLVISFVVCHMLVLNHRLFTKTLITSVIKGVTVIYILAQLKFETSEADFLRAVEATKLSFLICERQSKLGMGKLT